VAERRGLAARVGVTLLNLLAPGLGLLRIGRLRLALAVYGVVLGAFLTFIVALSTTKNISFGAYAALAGFLLAVTLAAYAGAMWWTWRDSGQLNPPRRAWSRWYFIVGAALTAFALSLALTGMSRSLYRTFYVPSEAMEPTLLVNDRFVAAMGLPDELRRGDVILVKTATGDTYVKRVAALPGDKIELKDGVVFINGASVDLKPAGTRPLSYSYMPPTKARMFWEKLPGETGSHMIQDLGSSLEDEMREVTVPADHVFVLGDNRDNSADSRVSKMMGGLELVPVEDVIGRALFMYWPPAKMGRSLREDR
jgi:signal peptidase I